MSQPRRFLATYFVPQQPEASVEEAPRRTWGWREQGQLLERLMGHRKDLGSSPA